jgi:hypothetical protein
MTRKARTIAANKARPIPACDACGRRGDTDHVCSDRQAVAR